MLFKRIVCLLFAGTLTAGVSAEEDLFLSDRFLIGELPSAIYRITLIDGVAPVALTAPLPAVEVCDMDNNGTASAGECPNIIGGPGEIPLIHALGLAGTQDGSRIYAIDAHPSGQGTFGYYDMEYLADNGVGKWVQVGKLKLPEVGGDPQPDILGVVLAAMARDDTLYVVSAFEDRIYRVNIDSGLTDDLGHIIDVSTNACMNVVGADIAFDSQENLLLWTNRGISADPISGCSGTPAGLYLLSNPADGAPVTASFLGLFGSEVSGVSGMAIRANGAGLPVVSNGTFQRVFELAENNAGIGTNYDLDPLIDLPDFTLLHTWGDMTNGGIVPPPPPEVEDFCGNRTIGYYKTHMFGPASNILNDVSVSLCGVTVEAETLDELLGDARGANFSMLFAQFMAAKLNCDLANDGEYNDNCADGTVDIIDQAEAFICDADILPQDPNSGPRWWFERFADRTERSEANGHAGALDDFNNRAGMSCDNVSNARLQPARLQPVVGQLD